LPRGPLLIVHPPPGLRLISAGGDVADLGATSVDRTSSLVAGVDIAALRFSGANILVAPTWATSVVSASKVPLVLQGQLDGRRVVVLGFDPSLSRLDQMAALPLLLANAVNWVLAPVDASVRQRQTTNVTPIGHAELVTPGSAQPGQGTPLDVWPWLVVLTAGVCAAEWWYYARHG
jgi:hypothetical protein